MNEREDEGMCEECHCSGCCDHWDDQGEHDET